MVTLRKDPTKNPKKWVQAAEFVPVSGCLTLYYLMYIQCVSVKRYIEYVVFLLIGTIHCIFMLFV